MYLKMKADDKVLSEDEKGQTIQEKFTNFELLLERVNVIQEQVNNISSCLSDNRIYRKFDVGNIEDLEAFNRIKENPIED